MLVLKDLDIKIEYDYPLNNKKTARCPEQFVCHNPQGDLYLVVFARTDIQEFYARRAVQYQKIFLQKGVTGMKCNAPIYSGKLEDGYYVIYRYFSNTGEVCGSYPHTWIIDYYENYSVEYEMSNDLVNKIESEFLSSWPVAYHAKLKQLYAFQTFHNELLNFETIKICFQHGDYTPNNILYREDGDIYLMDFEFSQKFQPIGFDLYDYHYATDRNFEDVPYLNLNRIKENLQNEINSILDSEYHIRVFRTSKESLQVKNERMHWSDYMIYNRPDLYVPHKTYRVELSYGSNMYSIYYTVNRYKSTLNIWLKPLPPVVIDELVEYIFKLHKQVLKIEINHAAANCRNQLKPDNNWVIFLPNSPEKILERLSKKSRYNFRREKRMLEEQTGKLQFIEYENSTPNEILNLFFKWKQETHGINYGLTGKEYLDKYHVNGTMVLTADGNYVAILFYCKNESAVYLEN